MNTLDRALERLERWLLFIAVLAGAAMMLHVAVDVFSRTVFGRPLSATNTVAARYYMVALAFLPLAFVSRTMGQISVDVFTASLRGWTRRGVEAFTGLLTLAYLGLVTWQATVSANRRTLSGEFVDLQVMIVPTWPGRWIVPLACGVLFLHVAIRLWRSLSAPDRDRNDEAQA